MRDGWVAEELFDGSLALGVRVVQHEGSQPRAIAFRLQEPRHSREACPRESGERESSTRIQQFRWPIGRFATSRLRPRSATGQALRRSDGGVGSNAIVLGAASPFHPPLLDSRFRGNDGGGIPWIPAPFCNRAAPSAGILPRPPPFRRRPESRGGGLVLAVDF